VPRASRVISQMATAAMPERRQVICHALKSAALIAAPPVEKRIAAPASSSRALERESMGREDSAQCFPSNDGLSRRGGPSPPVAVLR
jgi:hypothetical protein